MDKTPNRRPGLCSALAALAVLLVVLGWLFSPAFSGTEVLFTEGKTLGQWDAHLRGGAWDNQSGLGQPQVETRRGVSGLIQAICKLSPDPAANFANYHPLTCLLLLGMAAWLCARQLGTDSIVCGVVAIAAAFNGFFLTQSLQFSGAFAVAGAGMFVALAMILSPRFSWPHGLVAGAALGVGILETGTVGLYPAIALAALAGAVGVADEDRPLGPHRLIALGCLAIGTVAVGWPMLSQSPPSGPDLAGLDLLTLPVAGLFGHRADVADNSQHWGSFAGSHFHLHAGALVLLGAIWALVNALRRESTFSRTDQFRVLTFAGAGLVALLAMFGVVPRGSLLTFCSMALVMVFALGLKGLDEWHASAAHEKTRAFGSGGFDSRWRITMFALLTLATAGFAIYNGQTDKLTNWLADNAAGVSSDELASLVSVSILQSGVSVIYLFLSVSALAVCGMVKWRGPARTAGLLALGLLLLVDLTRPGEKFLRFDTLETNYRENPLTTKLKANITTGRVALLNDFRAPTNAPLDMMVADDFLVPKPPNTLKLAKQEDIQLARDFRAALMQYRTAEDMRRFNELLVALLDGKNEQAANQAFKRLQTLPGGQAFINGDGEQLRVYFMNASIARRQQLLAHEDIDALGLAFHTIWSRHLFPQLGIVRALKADYPPPPLEDPGRAEALRRLVRQWELASIRWFICQSGNEGLSALVKAEYRDLNPPTYRNALNKSLDPILRRFQHRLTSDFDDMGGGTNRTPVVLMEFIGALPRAKLFADWIQGVDNNSADQILFSPGFDPHSRVLLRQQNGPTPEQPSQTANLPEVKFTDANATRIELQIPATDFGSVLMLNDRHDPNWTVTLDGKPVPMLRANNHARAVHLPASDANRTVLFTYHPPRQSSYPVSAIALIIFVVGIVGLLRQPPVEPQTVETEPEADEA